MGKVSSGNYRSYSIITYTYESGKRQNSEDNRGNKFVNYKLSTKVRPKDKFPTVDCMCCAHNEYRVEFNPTGEHWSKYDQTCVNVSTGIVRKRKTKAISQSNFSVDVPRPISDSSELNALFEITFLCKLCGGQTTNYGHQTNKQKSIKRHHLWLHYRA